MTSAAARPVRVLIVEDEAIIAASLRRGLERLGMTIVAVADSSERAFDAAIRTSPEVVLMDVRLRDGSDGIEAAARIRTRLDVPIVYVTSHSDRSTLERVKQTMPDGFVLKPFDEREVVVAIELALDRHRRESVQPAAEAADADPDARERFDTLTAREREVFAGVVAGKLNREIAAELGTAERTIKAHRANVMRKMQVDSVAALTRLAAMLRM